MTDDIKLPPLPEWMSNYTIPADGFECDKNVMLVDRMHDYARAAVLADRQQRGWDVEAALRLFLTGDGFIAECDIPHIVAALTAQPAAHPDDAAVDRFAAAMKAKLAKKRAEGRGGWDDKARCTGEFLSAMLREHVDKGDPLDVGNLAMMLHQRGERISAQPAVVDEAIDKARFEKAPCYLCGYNGPGYYQPDTHPCAAKYHAAIDAAMRKEDKQ